MTCFVVQKYNFVSWRKQLEWRFTS